MKLTKYTTYFLLLWLLALLFVGWYPQAAFAAALIFVTQTERIIAALQPQG